MGLRDFGSYQRYLRFDPRGKEELELAIDLLLPRETYFFREPAQLTTFVDEVVPRLAQDAVGRSLHVWSAGCSTGEEVYTLAILVLRCPLFSGWDVRVFGNDISKRVLGIARRGVYPRHSFRAMPPLYDEFFEPDASIPGGGRRVIERVRSLCQFGQFNLLERDRAAILGRVDAIFCRNVLIYFDPASRRSVIEGFYERLQPGGYLMLGHSESLLNVSTAFELAHQPSDMVYRRPIASTSLLPPRGEGQR